MTGQPRPRTPSALLVLALLLALVGPAAATRPAQASGAARHLAASVPLTSGQAALHERTGGQLGRATDRRDQRGGHGPALLAAPTAAAVGAALLLAGLAGGAHAAGRRRRGGRGPADPRAPPLQRPA